MCLGRCTSELINFYRLLYQYVRYPLHPRAEVIPPPHALETESVPEISSTSKGTGKGKFKENPPIPKSSLVSHASTSGGTLILGHASLLTTFLLTADEKYIITADRDEHIRVSWYPQGYTIESFCLGSSQYVVLTPSSYGMMSEVPLQIRVRTPYPYLIS